MLHPKQLNNVSASQGDVIVYSSGLNQWSGELDSGIHLPQGTSAKRPSPVSGTIRFNETYNLIEYTDGTNWYPLIPLCALTSAGRYGVVHVNPFGLVVSGHQYDWVLEYPVSSASRVEVFDSGNFVHYALSSKLYSETIYDVINENYRIPLLPFGIFYNMRTGYPDYVVTRNIVVSGHDLEYKDRIFSTNGVVSAAFGYFPGRIVGRVLSAGNYLDHLYVVERLDLSSENWFHERKYEYTLSGIVTLHYDYHRGSIRQVSKASTLSRFSINSNLMELYSQEASSSTDYTRFVVRSSGFFVEGGINYLEFTESSSTSGRCVTIQDSTPARYALLLNTPKLEKYLGFGFGSSNFPPPILFEWGFTADTDRIAVLRRLENISATGNSLSGEYIDYLRMTYLSGTGLFFKFGPLSASNPYLAAYEFRGMKGRDTEFLINNTPDSLPVYGWVFGTTVSAFLSGVTTLSSTSWFVRAHDPSTPGYNQRIFMGTSGYHTVLRNTDLFELPRKAIGREDHAWIFGPPTSSNIVRVSSFPRNYSFECHISSMRTFSESTPQPFNIQRPQIVLITAENYVFPKVSSSFVYPEYTGHYRIGLYAKFMTNTLTTVNFFVNRYSDILFSLEDLYGNEVYSFRFIEAGPFFKSFSGEKMVILSSDNAYTISAYISSRSFGNLTSAQSTFDIILSGNLSFELLRRIF